MSSYVTIGLDADSNKEITIGAIEWRSGLYILGRSGMGKTNLIVNLIKQAIKNGYGVFFLDPHDGIDRLKSAYKDNTDFIDLNIQDETHSFGINLLKCKNVDSWVQRSDTYDRTRWVFFKLFETEFGERPWLESIIQNTLYVFIENQEYTLAEVPRFLVNPNFRNYLVSKVRYKADVVDFWKYHFQPKQAESALTRMTTLLGHDAVRHIVGQRETTLDFAKIMAERRIVLVKLPATLAPDIKKFIGTILISELLHAVRMREAIPERERHQFCIFVDEFQHFVNYEDFGTLITEARKYAVATTISHQERFGQLGDNKQIIGATDATVNKIFFRLSVRDAKEQAPEFAKAPPPPEKRWDAELVLSQYPVDDLVQKGHTNPKIQAVVNWYFRRFQEEMTDIKNQMEAERLIRMEVLDDSALYRLDERIENLRGYDRDYAVMERLLRSAERAVSLAGNQSEKLLNLSELAKTYFLAWRNFNKVLTSIMEGRFIPGTREFAQFTFNSLSYLAQTVVVKDRMPPSLEVKNIMAHYISLAYGDPREALEIPCWFALWADIFVEEALPRIGEAGKKSKEARRKFHEIYFSEKIEMFNSQIRGYERDDAFYISEREKEQKQIEEEIGAILVNNDVYDFNHFTEYSRDNRRKLELAGLNNKIMTLNYDPGNLSPRVLNRDERDALKKEYERKLIEKSPDILNKIAAFVECCVLLSQPENHIKVASGQYREKPIHMRPVHDMTDEMAQELASLPRSIAYAKVITEKRGEQTIWKGKIKTLSLPSWHELLLGVDSPITNRSHIPFDISCFTMVDL